jgi:hypothetical protein
MRGAFDDGRDLFREEVALARAEIRQEHWSPWTGFAIVGVLVGIAGGAMLMIARGIARDVRPLPRTVNSVKENLQ